MLQPHIVPTSTFTSVSHTITCIAVVHVLPNNFINFSLKPLLCCWALATILTDKTVTWKICTTPKQKRRKEGMK